MLDALMYDYLNARSLARYWARMALDNKRDAMPWKIAASNAHQALRYALMIMPYP